VEEEQKQEMKGDEEEIKESDLLPEEKKDEFR
jgi:hypothetical protein